MGVSANQIVDALGDLEPLTPGEVRLAEVLAECETYAEAAAILGLQVRSVRAIASVIRTKGYPIPIKVPNHVRVHNKGQRSATLSPTTVLARAMLNGGDPQCEVRRKLKLTRSQISGIAFRVRAEAKAKGVDSCPSPSAS
jgi:hypothetical protein